MSNAFSPQGSLRELLSAAAVDPSLRRRMKARAHAVLEDWGIRAPGRTVYFVEPGEAPAEGHAGDAFIELPHAAPSLPEDALDVVAGGWAEARERAVAVVDTAVSAVAWRDSNPWLM